MKMRNQKRNISVPAHQDFILSSMGVSVEELSSQEGVELAIKLLWAFLKLEATTWDLEILRGCLTETEKEGAFSTLFLEIGDDEEPRVENIDCERTVDAIVKRLFV